MTNHPHRNRIFSVETNQEFNDGWETEVVVADVSKHLDRGGVICSTHAGFRVNIGNGRKNSHN